MLNVLDLKRWNNQSCNLSRLLSVIGNGGTAGVCGGAARRGQPQEAVGSLGSVRDPVSGTGFNDAMVRASTALLLVSPMVGKLSDITPKSVQAPLLR